MDGENEGHGARIGLLPGAWKGVIEREPPLRVENRQGQTERLEIGGANGIMRCRS
jgi:hypothetical protein